MPNEIRLFTGKSGKPDEQGIAAGLGSSYPFYVELMEAAGRFSREWKYTKNGWMLRLAGRKKALFYLIPLSGSFRLSLTLRETEMKNILNDPDLGFVHEALVSAKKYSEGYALQFLVEDPDSHRDVLGFLSVLIGFRQGE